MYFFASLFEDLFFPVNLLTLHKDLCDKSLGDSIRGNGIYWGEEKLIKNSLTPSCPFASFQKTV